MRIASDCKITKKNAHTQEHVHFFRLCRLRRGSVPFGRLFRLQRGYVASRGVRGVGILDIGVMPDALYQSPIFIVIVFC